MIDFNTETSFIRDMTKWATFNRVSNIILVALTAINNAVPPERQHIDNDAHWDAFNATLNAF